MSLVIDGTTYAIPIISCVRKADFLDKYAERTNDGKLHRELIGVYFNYQLKLGNTLDQDVYEALWKKLTEPVEFHTVTVPDESGAGNNYTFTAYFSNVGDEVRKTGTGGNHFKGLTVNFIAQKPARS